MLSIRVIIVLTRQESSSSGTTELDIVEIRLETKEVIFLDLRRRSDLLDITIFKPLRRLL